MNAIMPLVTTFIAVSIILGIGVVILAGTSTSLDCKNVTGGTDGTGATGWKKTCQDIAAQSQSGYALLIVTLIIIAAITILIVVRML